MKRQQERICMLRRLAGEEEFETSPTAAEVDELVSIEEERTANASKTLFLALQAVSMDRTYHRKTTVKDKDGESEYDLDIVVTVKKVKQSASVAIKK